MYCTQYGVTGTSLELGDAAAESRALCPIDDARNGGGIDMTQNRAAFGRVEPGRCERSRLSRGSLSFNT
jgi:hypothetical protein